MECLKGLQWLGLGVGCLLFMACGDSGSSKFDLEDSFEVVLEKQNYEYKSKDSLLILKRPECAEGVLGYLVWNKESRDNDSIKAYLKGGKAYFRYLDEKEWEVLNFEGKSFPKGLYYSADDSRKSIRFATRIDKKVNEVLQYDGTCFMKSYYNSAFEGNKALSDADNAFIAFYSKFLDGEFDKKEAIEDIRANDCDEMTFFGGDVSIELDYLKESSGKIVLKYDKSKCPIEFNIRYAQNEDDCSAAYEDYEREKSKDEIFDFYDYSVATDYSSYCIERLVLDFKKDKGSLTKRAPVTEEIPTAAIARNAVKIFISSLKK